MSYRKNNKGFTSCITRKPIIYMVHLIGIVPPTINFEEKDENIDYDSIQFVFNKAVKAEIEVALSNTFGFGGHNASMAFKKFRR